LLASLILIPFLLTPLFAWDAPGISGKLPAPVLETRYMILDKETDTRIMVVVGHLTGLNPDTTTREIFDGIFARLLPQDPTAEEVRSEPFEEHGWDARLCASRVGKMSWICKVWMLNKGELRILMIQRDGPIPVEYWLPIINSFRVIPRDQA